MVRLAEWSYPVAGVASSHVSLNVSGVSVDSHASSCVDHDTSVVVVSSLFHASFIETLVVSFGVSDRNLTLSFVAASFLWYRHFASTGTDLRRIS